MFSVNNTKLINLKEDIEKFVILFVSTKSITFLLNGLKKCTELLTCTQIFSVFKFLV
jgi:hypothetical protein